MEHKSIFLVAMVFAICSCLQEISSPEISGDDSVSNESEQIDSLATQAVLQLNIGCAVPVKTKSSIPFNESTLSNVNIYAFRDGKLYASLYSETPSAVTLKLAKGCRYDLYALGNVGHKPVNTINESEFKMNMGITVNSISEFSNQIPLSWSMKDYVFNPSSSTGVLEVSMRKMVAKINFALNKGSLRGLDITSVKLCQAARRMRPFLQNNKAESSSDVMDGDHASASDLSSLNAGGVVSFYAFENMQGDLLPSNTDPWAKNPDNINSKKDVCTFIEVKGIFQPGFFYSGDVTYRFYLGYDNVTNFDVIRNAESTITLSLTGDGLKEISWKVVPNINIEEGFASGSISHGLHGIDDLYIGEMPIYSVKMEKELLEYFHHDVSGVGLLFEPDNGTASALHFEPLSGTGDPSVFSCRLKCLDTASGAIWLIDKDGTKLMRTSSNVLIQKPLLAISNHLEESVDDHRPNKDDLSSYRNLAFTINGDLNLVNYDDYGYGLSVSQKCDVPFLYIFLTDRNGVNLNAEGHSFDNSLFTPTFGIGCSDAKANISSSLKIEKFSSLPSDSGNASWRFLPKIVCPSDYDLSYDLSRIYALNDFVELSIDSKNADSSRTKANLDILPIHFVLTDPIKYDPAYDSPGLNQNTELVCIIKNPSNVYMSYRVGMISNLVSEVETNPSHFDSMVKESERLYAQGKVKRYIYAHPDVNFKNSMGSSHVDRKNCKYFDISDKVYLRPGYEDCMEYTSYPLNEQSQFKDGQIKVGEPVYYQSLPGINIFSNCASWTYVPGSLKHRMTLDYFQALSDSEKKNIIYKAFCIAHGTEFYVDSCIGDVSDSKMENPSVVYFTWDENDRFATRWEDRYWEYNPADGPCTPYPLLWYQNIWNMGYCDFDLPFGNGSIDHYDEVWDGTADEILKLIFYRQGNQLYVKTNGKTARLEIQMRIRAEGSVKTKRKSGADWEWHIANPYVNSVSSVVDVSSSGKPVDMNMFHKSLVSVSDQYWTNNSWQPVPVKWEDKHARPEQITVSLIIGSADKKRYLIETEFPKTWNHSFHYESTKWKNHPDDWSGEVDVVVNEHFSDFMIMAK